MMNEYMINLVIDNKIVRVHKDSEEYKSRKYESMNAVQARDS